MKIGLLTFHETTNFGSYLQTYGLYNAICMLGYDCEVIDYKCESIIKRELPKSKPKSFFPRDWAKYLLIERKKKKKYFAFQKQVSNTIKLSRPYDNFNIMTANKMYDAFIVGSDILWNLEITGGDQTFFLNFVENNQKKYAYSTSIGNPWEEEERSIILPLLKNFRKISLREKTSAIWLSNFLKKKVEAVCDPTMLMDRSVWDKIQENRINKWGDYVLTYFNTKQMLDDARFFAKKYGYQIISINYGLPIKGVKNVSPYEVAEFLTLIKYAKTVFTASYHGMLFAIYYEIPFYCYMRSNGNNIRFQDVLERLKLKECNRDDQGTLLNLDIDYQSVTTEVKKWRDESLKVLKNLLGDINYVCL